MKITVYPKYLVRRLLIKSSKTFFSAGYRSIYPEYRRHGMTPWQHYVVDGRRKGYDDGNHPPRNIFFAEGYLAMYPDVAAAGADPWHHYVLAGKKEGRDNGLHPDKNMFFAEGYLEMYPDVAAAGVEPWRHYVLAGKKEGRDNGLHPDENMFFAEGYLEMYPDVSAAGVDPWHHYVLTGKKEGRDNGLHPNELQFFAKGYLEMYHDVARKKIDPWRHYVLQGKKNGFDNGLHPSGRLFSADDYLGRYPDVAQANINPWRHYILSGRSEGRIANPDIKYRGKALQQKDKIKVMFILSNLPKWKTELLYRAMKSNSRFEPVIGVAAGILDFPSEIVNKINNLEKYLISNNYDFIELATGIDIKEKFNPDIIFYQEAGDCINHSLTINCQSQALSCYVQYCFNNTLNTKKESHNREFPINWEITSRF